MLFVGVITVIFVMAAVVIDVGLWLAERRSAQRAADLGAAAGAQDLLVSDSDAVAAAYDWAEKNGYDASEVSVDLLCYNDSSSNAICDNPNPGVGPIECTTGQNCDSLRVTIRKPSTLLFASIFGVDAFDIEAGATAGLTISPNPVDTVILLDATGSMGSTFGGLCDPGQTIETCPMVIAREAANDVVGMLLGGLNTASQVGYAAYNYCYGSPFGNPTRDAECIKDENIVALTSNMEAIRSAIDGTMARGGTNLCIGLDKAGELFSVSAQPGAARKLIVLSDGEGGLSYLDGAYPPAECRPNPLAVPPNSILSGCDNGTQANEADLEDKTLQLAQELKSMSVEIYVVSLLRCGPEDGQNASPSYCAGVGTAGASDRIADQRLLKCVASSPGNYVLINSASQIPDAFREIAAAIISRGLLE